jgi:hypothetical protein
MIPAEIQREIRDQLRREFEGSHLDAMTLQQVAGRAQAMLYERWAAGEIDWPWKVVAEIGGICNHVGPEGACRWTGEKDATCPFHHEETRPHGILVRFHKQ